MERKQVLEGNEPRNILMTQGLVQILRNVLDHPEDEALYYNLGDVMEEVVNMPAKLLWRGGNRYIAPVDHIRFVGEALQWVERLVIINTQHVCEPAYTSKNRRLRDGRYFMVIDGQAKYIFLKEDAKGMINGPITITTAENTISMDGNKTSFKQTPDFSKGRPFRLELEYASEVEVETPILDLYRRTLDHYTEKGFEPVKESS